MAVTFHEVWKPTVYDKDLHSRMGRSFATHAFLTIRTALRREMVLALARIWDSNKKAIRMTAIRDDLRDKKVIDALALDLVNRRGWPEAIDQMKSALEQRATVALRLIHKYLEGGTNASVLKNLTTLRNEHLAHRDLAPTTAEEANAPDKEIEDFTKIPQSSSTSSSALSMRQLMTLRTPPKSTDTMPASSGPAREEKRPTAIRTIGSLQLDNRPKVRTKTYGSLQPPLPSQGRLPQQPYALIRSIFAS